MASPRSEPVFARGDDARPRIHVWPCRSGFQWSDGPRGGRSAPYGTIGRAVDAALLAFGVRGEAVIILEAPSHG